MKNRNRLMGLLILFVLVVSAGVLIFWYLCPEANLTKESVKVALEKLTNKPVALEDVHIRFSPTSMFDITIDNLDVEFPDSETHVSVHRLNLQPSILSLLKLEVLISSITVEGLLASVTVGTADGTTAFPFPIPVGGLTGSERSPDKTSVGSDDTQPKQEATQSTADKTSSRLKVQINQVRIVDARIDLLPSASDESNKKAVSISDMAGELRKIYGGPGYTFHLKGEITSADNGSSPFRTRGSLAFNDQQFPLAEADIELLVESLRVGPWMRITTDSRSQFNSFIIERLDARLSSQSDKALSLKLKTSLKGHADETAKLNAEVEIVPSKSFKSVETARVRTQIEELPVRFVEEISPASLPLTFASGVLQGEVHGSWQGNEWATRGLVKLERCVATFTYFHESDPWSAFVEWESHGQQVIIQRMNIAVVGSNLDVSGDISGPLGNEPTFNLSYRGTIGPEVIIAAQVRALDVSGSMGVAGNVKGTLNDFWLHANIDMSSIALAKLPYFQKTSGTTAKASLNAHISATETRPAANRWVDGEFKGLLSDIKIGIDTKSPPSIDARTEFQSKIFADRAGLTLNDMEVTLIRSDTGNKVFTTSGALRNLGSASERFRLQSDIRVDREFLRALSLLPPDISLSGTTSAALKLSGTRKVVDWSANASLNNIVVKTGQTLIKPSGVPCNLAGVGKWREGRLSLAKGELSAPGLVVNAQGDVLARHGKFERVNVEVKKADLAQIGKQFLHPDFTVSGSIFGQIIVEAAENSIATTGTLNATGVGIALAKPNSLGCAGLNGALEIHRNKVRTEQLRGRLTGIVEAPLRLRGSFDTLYPLENVAGEVFVETGKGKIRTDFLATATKQVRAIGEMVGQTGIASTERLLEITAGTACVRIHSGLAETQDLRIKGPAIAVGAIGAYRFKDKAVDSLVSIQTNMLENLPIGNIPVVQDFLKQHEGLLKASGLDKELGKYGIRLPQTQPEESHKPGEQRIPPATFIFTLRGPIQGPQLIPVLESSLDKNTVNRLKKLSQL